MRLFRQLFNWFLFSGTMFATGDVGLGGGGEIGSSDAGSAGGDSGGDASGVSQGDGSGAEQDLSADASGESGQGEGDGETDPNAPVDLGDGRTVPAKWKALFDKAKESGLEKEVRQLFFGNQRLTQKFPGGINEAVQLADKVEEFGGLDGIGEIKQDNEAFHADANSFLDTPQQWIAETFTNNAEASLKAFSHALDYVGEHHAEFYDHTMAKVIINDLGALRVDRIYDVLAALKDNPDAKQLAGQLAEYYNHRLKLSQKVPEKQNDPNAAKLTEKEQTLATKEENLNNHTVNSQTIPLLGRNMTTQIERLAKDAGFDLKTLALGASKAMRGEILKRVMDRSASDKTFVRNYKSVMKEGNTQRAIKMMNDKHNAILPEIVRAVAKDYGIAKKAGAVKGQPTKRTQQASGQSKGILKVSEKPASNTIDWTKTGNDIYDSIATLKDGRKVTWA